MPQVSGSNDPLWEQAQFTYQNGVWRKQPMIFGYTDRWSEYIINANAAVGVNIVTTAVVPSGYIYIAQEIGGLNVNTNPTTVGLYLNDGTNFIITREQAAPGAGVWVIVNGSWVLKAGDSVKVQFVGCALNDDLHLSVWGYKMKIND